ncbi:MAG TPA: VOC family protein [Opitutaceae bacterium]|nr:VOC family protein [Opitutaceae bacterium]
MIQIKEVAYTVLPVTDIERARAFYEGVLGLVPGKTFSSKAGVWVEYDLGATTLSITSMIDAAWQPSPHGAAVALEVVDFDAAVVWLKGKGVRFQTEPWEGSSCRMATVFDPDGNCLAIHRLK